MDRPYHTLLPVYMQRALRDAAALERIEAVDATVRALQEQTPERFHNENTVARRRFYNEPRQSIPCASFVVPIPAGMSRA